MAKTRQVEPIKVLVVEDHKPSRLPLMKLAKDMGYTAAGCETVAQARELLKDAPHILILDLMLPDGNGTEILQQVRESDLPVRVAVVSGAGDDMLMEASKLRPDALFGKPIDLADFKDWLSEPAKSTPVKAAQKSTKKS